MSIPYSHHPLLSSFSSSSTCSSSPYPPPFSAFAPFYPPQNYSQFEKGVDKFDKPERNEIRLNQNIGKGDIHQNDSERNSPFLLFSTNRPTLLIQGWALLHHPLNQSTSKSEPDTTMSEGDEKGVSTELTQFLEHLKGITGSEKRPFGYLEQVWKHGSPAAPPISGPPTGATIQTTELRTRKHFYYYDSPSLSPDQLQWERVETSTQTHPQNNIYTLHYLSPQPLSRHDKQFCVRVSLFSEVSDNFSFFLPAIGYTYDFEFIREGYGFLFDLRSYVTSSLPTSLPNSSLNLNNANATTSTTDRAHRSSSSSTPLGISYGSSATHHLLSPHINITPDPTCICITVSRIITKEKTADASTPPSFSPSQSPLPSVLSPSLSPAISSNPNTPTLVDTSDRDKDRDNKTKESEKGEKENEEKEKEKNKEREKWIIEAFMYTTNENLESSLQSMSILSQLLLPYANLCNGKVPKILYEQNK